MTKSTNLLALCGALLLLFTTWVHAAFADSIACGDDWAQEATAALSNGTPIMLVFTANECSYCERLKRELLEPLMQSGALDASVRLRQFNINRGGKITDFDGERVRSRIFVNRYHVFATPTLVLLDHQGNLLAPPIVGFDNAEHYQILLSEAMAQAQPKLAFGAARAAALD